MNSHVTSFGGAGWRSGESARLPQMLPGLGARVLFQVLRLSSLHKKPHSQFEFDNWNRGPS